jgi:hypothetical protein
VVWVRRVWSIPPDAGVEKSFGMKLAFERF